MMNKSTWKRICGMMLTLVLMVPCFALPAYAAGSHTVSGTYAPEGVTLPEPTEFKLYSVGGFSRSEDGTKSILVLDQEGLKDFTGEINLSIQRDSYAEDAAGEKQWTEDWLAQAKTLADWIETREESPVAVRTTKTDASGSFAFQGVENGLYLLTGGPRQKVKGADDTNDSTWYYPRPMFVQVLNGDVQLTVKPGTENVKDFTVVKAWNNDGRDALQPKEVTVNLYYGTELEKTVQLNDSNNWMYTWETNKVEKEWRAVEEMDEEMAKNYFPSTKENIDNTQHKKVITITNTYKRLNLDLTKKTDQIVTPSDSSNIVAAFKLTGYIGDKVVYTGSASVVIDKTEVPLNVGEIPRNLTRLEVEEVYSGANYKAKTTKQDATFIPAVISEDGTETTPAHYEVTFENEYTGDTTTSGGIVNTFKKGVDEVYKITQRAGAQAEQ